MSAIGTIAATEANIATIIDVRTQVFRSLPALTAVVRSMQKASLDTLKADMEELRGAVEALQEVHSRMPQDMQPLVGAGYRVSAPALHAARSLMDQYAFTAIQKIQATENNIGILIDVCTQVFRVGAAAEVVARLPVWGSKADVHEHYRVVRAAVRAVEVIRNRMPNAPPAHVVTVHQRQEVELRLTKAQLQRSQSIAKQVAAARTVSEQQSILVNAGFVTTP